MSSYDFLGSFSTPKRRRTSYGKASQLESPIDGLRRRKVSTHYDPLNNQLFPVFSGSFDSPTSRQCPADGARLTSYFPTPESQAPFQHNDLNRNTTTKVDYLLTSPLMTSGTEFKEICLHPKITQSDLENMDLGRNLSSLRFEPENFSQPANLSIGSMKTGFNNRQSEMFLAGSHRPEADHGVLKPRPTSFSNSSLDSVSLISDSIPSQDQNHTSNFSAFTGVLHSNRCQIQPAIKFDERGIESSSPRPIMDDDLYRLFNVPLLSIDVTNHPREDQNIVNIIRCEAMKRKLCSRDRDIWSEDTSRAFDEAVKVIPRLGRAKVLALTREGPKPFGRNELIADYIYRRTGIVRDRKQVSSHIQVIKNSKKLETSSELTGSSNISENLSFDASSASWFGAYMTKGVLTLYPCTPEFPFPSRILEHQGPPQTDDEYDSFLRKVLEVRKAKSFA